MISKKIRLKRSKKSKKGARRRSFLTQVPEHEMPEHGMPAHLAYRLVHNELKKSDVNPLRNLASFVTTWMDPEAYKLITENVHKNFIDHDQYPQTARIHERLVSMLARLFNAPERCASIGTCTVGSSEAVMLGLLAHKWTWKKRRIAEGKPYDQPNVIFGADAHVCWDKFARYFDVEPRVIPMVTDRFTITAEEVRKRIDENTIAVGTILGTTFTGQADPIKEINELLLTIRKQKGWNIPIHVDAASGGFIAPFVHPELEWDFRLSQVKSINVSGHKYGFVYPGLGWLIFRDESDLPKQLVFKVNYLGGEIPTFTFSFSRGSAMVLAQYYNFLRLGKQGYRKVVTEILENARYLAGRLADTARFEILNGNQLLPIIAFKLKEPCPFSVFDLSRKVREGGWIVSAYTLPPNAESVAIMRIVARRHFTRDNAETLFRDILRACRQLEKAKAKKIAAAPQQGDAKHQIC